jgi:hypothetical protein
MKNIKRTQFYAYLTQGTKVLSDLKLIYMLYIIANTNSGHNLNNTI